MICPQNAAYRQRSPVPGRHPMPLHRPPFAPARTARLAALLLSLGCALNFTTALAGGALAVQLNPAQMQALGIEVQQVQAAEHAAQNGLPARVVVPNEQMRLVSAPVGGLVEALLVAPGQAVKKGQIVARLSSPEALALQRDGAQAASQARLAEHAQARDAQLFAEGLIAESRLQASRAQAEQAAALLAERRQRLALAGLAEGGGTAPGSLALRAPIDGEILEQSASIGQRLEAASPLYRIARLHPLWLEIQAPLALAAQLSVGTRVSVPALQASGKLIALGRAVDSASQTVLLRAEIDQGSERLRPGQAVEASLELKPGALAGAALLPASALVRVGEQTLVFVQQKRAEKAADAANATPGAAPGPAATPDKAAGNVEWRAVPVRVLGQSGNSALVSGVLPGAQIAVRGVSGLKAMLPADGAQ